MYMLLLPMCVCFSSFLSSLGGEYPTNHWTRRVMSTQIIMWDPRKCSGPLTTYMRLYTHEPYVYIHVFVPRVYTCIFTHVYLTSVYTNLYLRVYTYVCMHVCNRRSYVCIHAIVHTRARRHAFTPSPHTHTHMHTRIHECKHAYTPTRTHTHPHTHTHTNTSTHTQAHIHMLSL